MVVGHLNCYYPELAVRICNGGHFCPIPAEQVLEPMPDESFPAAWLARIKTAKAPAPSAFVPGGAAA